MKIYHRYIFLNTLLGFGAFVLVFVSLIWFSRAISFVRYITENGIALGQFFYLFVLILPWLLLFIIPISLFASVLLVYNRLIMNNEIAILKNSGLTKILIGKPVLWLALLSSIICFAISFYFMPAANKELRLSRINFKENYTNLAINSQTFETLKNLTIYAKNRNSENQLSGILLYDERSNNYSITITAEKGSIGMENNSALLYMDNGTIQKFNYETRKTEILNFDNYVFNLTENKAQKSTMRWKPKERFLNELINPQDNPSSDEIDLYSVEVHKRLTYPMLPIVFSTIALASILRGSFNRRGNLSNIILATAFATIFLILVIVSYNLIESSLKFIPLLYVVLVSFFMVSIYTLISNYRIKR